MVDAMAEVEVVQLLVSADHRFAGRPADGPAPGPTDERVTQVRVRRGLGLVGDRYFGRAAHRDAAVTIMSERICPRPSTRTSICGRRAATFCCAASTSTRSWER